MICDFKYVSMCFVIAAVTATACNRQSSDHSRKTVNISSSIKNIPYQENSVKVIHVFVALCDNKYQGIIPVPPKIGNGRDPENNLYWGGDYGVRTYFKRSKDWRLLKKHKVNKIILERLIFKHITTNTYLVADAYDGQSIGLTTSNFLYSCSGQLKDTLHLDNKVIGDFGNAQLLCYIGHDGLMDFRLKNTFKNADHKQRDCIILACISKKYFNPFIKTANANPLLWTTGLMCPEAYTLHDAITGYLAGEPATKIHGRAVSAYNKYQKSGLNFANALLVSGWK